MNVKKVRHYGIQQTKNTCGGQARIKGTRITVQTILSHFVRGAGMVDIAGMFNLKVAQVQDAIQYAARCAKRFDP